MRLVLLLTLCACPAAPRQETEGVLVYTGESIHGVSSGTLSPGRRWRYSPDKCNTCSCVDDACMCTLVYCRSDLSFVADMPPCDSLPIGDERSCSLGPIEAGKGK